MTRGRNSTTRSWTVTGMDPSNPYSDGWRENLELYASMNGLKIKNNEAFQNYGVRPKDSNVCPEFTGDDIDILEGAVPNFSSVATGETTILNHPKAMCYAVANDIIVNWSELDFDLRSLRPRAMSSVEKLALQHMDIVQIITVTPKSNESLLLDVNYEERKRDGIITLTKPLESIQIQPNNTDNKKLWYSALKVNNGSWHVHNGDQYFDLTTNQLQLLYTINLNHNMFPNDKRLQENGWRSDRRRRNEKSLMIQRIAKTLAEEDRRAELKEVYDSFMNRPEDEKSFHDFETKVVTNIERPSNHTVTGVFLYLYLYLYSYVSIYVFNSLKFSFSALYSIVKLGDEEHVMRLSAHGNNTSSVSQLVINNVCKTIIGNSNRNEKKKNKKRRGGRVGRVRRGSDGVVKSLQMDQQHQKDLSTEEEIAEKKKKNDTVLCKRRLTLIQTFQSMEGYDSIWNDDSTIDLQKVIQKHLKHLLKIFNVTGRAKLITNGPIRAALSELAITQASIDALKSKLLQQLEEHGEEYDPDSNVLDSSFADGSIADHSIGSTLNVDTSIIDTSIDQSNISFVIDIDIDESEIGDAGSKTDDTAELIANLPKKKQTVSFNLTPSVKTSTRQATTSFSSSDDGGKCSPIKATVAATSSSSSEGSGPVSVSASPLRFHLARPDEDSDNESSSMDGKGREIRSMVVSGGMPKIDRTPKVFYGGKQKRPDATYVRPVISPSGEFIGQVAEGNRKDVRNAVEAAHKGKTGWGKRAAHNRAQIMYYIAENLELRMEEIAGRISAMTGRDLQSGRDEVHASINRLFHWAAYADKYGGTVQETSFYGATVKVNEPVGVIGIACPEDYPLLGLVSLFAPAVVRGNVVVMIPR